MEAALGAVGLPEPTRILLLTGPQGVQSQFRYVLLNGLEAVMVLTFLILK